MKEDLGPELGINIATSIAGMLGALVSLAGSQGLTRPQALAALGIGLISANYLTPIVVVKLAISPDLQNGTAFILGLCSLSIIPGIKKYAPAFAVRFLGLGTPPTQGDGGSK